MAGSIFEPRREHKTIHMDETPTGARLIGANSSGVRVYETDDSAPTPAELRVNKRRKKERPRFDGEPAMFSEQVAKNVHKRSPCVTPGEMEKLKKLKAAYDELSAFVSSHSREAARGAFSAQHAKSVKALSGGKTAEVDSAEHWTEEDWIQDFSLQRQAAAEQMRKINQSAFPIAEAIAARLAKAAKEWSDEMESAQRAECQAWGLPFRPSPVLLALAALAADVGPYLPIQDSAFTQPGEILARLGALE